MKRTDTYIVTCRYGVDGPIAHPDDTGPLADLVRRRITEVWAAGYLARLAREDAEAAAHNDLEETSTPARLILRDGIAPP